MRLALTGNGVAAVTGARATITVTSADGAVFQHHLGEAFSLDDGDELELGSTERGTRAYIAFRGGIEAETALGSASADTLADLGPAHLEPGTTISSRATGVGAPPRRSHPQRRRSAAPARTWRDDRAVGDPGTPR